jgi:hypothetical protein
MSRVFRCTIRTANGTSEVLIIIDVTKQLAFTPELLSDILTTLRRTKGEAMELVGVEDIGQGVISVGSAKSLAVTLNGGPGGEMYRH